MKKLRVLLFGHCQQLLMLMPSLLHRSGFNVEVISTNEILANSNFVDKFTLVNSQQEMLNLIRQKNLDDYDFIIPGDDPTIKLITDCDLPIAQKLKLLPVLEEKNFVHLFSKIGLSQILSSANINTPPFAIANNQEQAELEAEKIGYPLMVKVNSSSGGDGTFECNSKEDLQKIPAHLFHQPILIQKRIIGCELDLSGLFRDGKLIYFTHSTIKKVAYNKFGPSSVRIYQQLGTIDHNIFSQMEQLGTALGANGFATISCIEDAQDKKLYFIEADMRPNAWAQFGKFFGDDPAVRIKRWFLNQEAMRYPLAINKNYPSQLLLPLFFRLPFKDVLRNRYKIWKYLPWEEYRILFRVLCPKYEAEFKPYLRKMKKAALKTIRHIPSKIGRFFISEKEVRLKLRRQIKQIFCFKRAA